MNYPLENLGPARFQQLCQALLSKSFPDAQCFPIAQADGGRDATVVSRTQNGKEFIVFQVKYSKHALKDRQPHKSLLDSLRKEVPKLSNKIGREARKYVLMTNVPGTGGSPKGSIDILQGLFDRHISVPTQCWWRDEIERRLDDAWDIKWSFPEVLGSQDIVRTIIERGLTEDAERRARALRLFVREQFEYDSDVRFKQIDLQNKLLDLFMDVPINLRGYDDGVNELRREHRALFEVARQNDSFPPQRESKLGAATVLLDAITQTQLSRIVLEGAPGQGKSTIAQYVCQVHRGRLLGTGTMDGRISATHRNSPVRLPFKIDCRDFSSWLRQESPFRTGDSDVMQRVDHWTLESFLATQISKKSGGVVFDVNDLHAVTSRSAVLIVFDGLDEVANISERRKVVEEITKSIRRVEELAVSLQTIVTSRPTAFADSPGLPRSQFLYLQLGPIDTATIVDYARKWVVARKLLERDAADVRGTLEKKLDQPHLRDLARNPMQLSILLSLIHRKGTSLPDKRTALYDNYIGLFFDREAEKSEVVREQRELLVDIHRYLAWVLHFEAQTKRTGGRIENVRLRDVVQAFLKSRGHEVGLLDVLFSGMVERVVALVSRIEGSYEFEVQPMREYFAARYLYDTAPYSPAGAEQPGTLPERFEALAVDPFWQNVTRFYAGCYSQGELPSLISSLRSLSRREEYKNTCYPQSLAVTLLSDYTFAQYPFIVEDVVDFVLNSVDLRVMVAQEQYTRRGDSLYVPKGSGNRELLDRCFSELRQRAPVDYSQLLLEIITNNSDREERRSRWWSTIERIDDEKERTRWISYGLDLGVLKGTEPRIIEDLLKASDDEYRERIFSFSFGEMSEYVLQDSTHINAIVEILLDRNNELFIPSSRRTDSIVC